MLRFFLYKETLLRVRSSHENRDERDERRQGAAVLASQVLTGIAGAHASASVIHMRWSVDTTRIQPAIRFEHVPNMCDNLTVIS